MFPETIETERLRLRRLSTDLLGPLDAYDAFAPSRSPTIEEETEYVLFEPHDTPKETADFVVETEEAWTSNERAGYAVLPDDDPADYDGPTVEGRPFAGTTGLAPEWDRRLAEFGIHLRKPFWGRGYSGERAAALFDLAFDVLDLDLVAVDCLVGNERSERAVEKYVDRFGGRRDGLLRNRAVLDGDPVDAHRFSVTADEWRAAVADADPADRPTVEYEWSG